MKTECLSCGIKFNAHKEDIHEDKMGKFIRCPNCEATMNIEEE